MSFGTLSSFFGMPDDAFIDLLLGKPGPKADAIYQSFITGDADSYTLIHQQHHKRCVNPISNFSPTRFYKEKQATNAFWRQCWCCCFFFGLYFPSLFSWIFFVCFSLYTCTAPNWWKLYTYSNMQNAKTFLFLYKKRLSNAQNFIGKPNFFFLHSQHYSTIRWCTVNSTKFAVCIFCVHLHSRTTRTHTRVFVNFHNVFIACCKFLNALIFCFLVNNCKY